MDKLYEILVSYEGGKSVDLIKLPKEEIDERIQAITSGQMHGKLYVIEIDTLIGTALVNNSENVICYYDQAPLADIVVKNNKLEIKPQQKMTFYIEKTIKEMEF
ncbi:MAG: hypothetical protein ACOX7R_03575 [Acetivibrionales bacterium]